MELLIAISLLLVPFFVPIRKAPVGPCVWPRPCVTPK